MMVALGGVAALLLLSVCSRGRVGGGGDAEMVKKMLSENALVLDVRTAGEFSGGHYPGALNIAVQELPQRIADLPKGRPIVVYCASGARSERARRMLEQAGFQNVVNAGGLSQMPRP